MRPNFHVQIFSEALWQEGLDAVLQRLTQWFASLGFSPERDEVCGKWHEHQQTQTVTLSVGVTW
ncbi:hypothetical protein [Rhodospirillaceae bacterium SYSU D60014]|uniref:hypothetical protein n=1 Tax=Virgifigura deserti TaxID=2268457 RepID=UPI000E669CD3